MSVGAYMPMNICVCMVMALGAKKKSCKISALLTFVGAVEVTLTAREFNVLEFLVRRAGQVVTKDEILAGVWDSDFDAESNIVEVYILRLRRKVDGPFGRRSIETVRGAGYRMAKA